MKKGTKIIAIIVISVGYVSVVWVGNGVIVLCLIPPLT